ASLARILVAAAGTGGHVYPGLAVADALKGRGHHVSFVGGARMEATAVPAAGYRLHQIPGRGLPRSASPRAVLAGIDLLRAVARCRRIVAREGVDAVVGFGGYHSVAPCVAAGTTGRAVVLHEQNGHLSLAHRLSLRWADALALSVPLPSDPAGVRVAVTGNPLRPPVRTVAEMGPDERARVRTEALTDLGLAPHGRTTVLAFGGSLGARPINRGVVAAARSWSGRDDVQVIHLTGPDLLEETREAWDEVDVPRTVLDYMPTIERAYAAADLVVTRSGGATAELVAFGLPSVLVPGPWATGGHQEANARWVADAGGGVLVREDEPDLEGRLARVLTELLDDPGRRRTMAESARALGRPDAADRLADLVEDELRRRSHGDVEPAGPPHY
ncbi:MAG TPA: UDP-N-acetylglucosamine--N-acetylmuramyl-(pentapeptide) pyrophosphoryl-undecaprenol N-acetylglucosamine transferase, partial [Actinomycetota bacterium]|nr:UDP-N-acetylglucosamine--N-acetylmuramyl-(pentapeptide) pyrophosphoryl-undecaprenol N-acetylglucosamine transferase [Actinomycetota bacterium]